MHRRILEHLNKAQHSKDLEILYRADINYETCEEIIRGRDSISPLGFRHLSEVVEVTRIDQEATQRLVSLFGPATFGEWTIPY